MKLTVKNVLLMAGILIFSDIHAQNIQELFIETLSTTEAADIYVDGIDNGSCNAGDMVITIKSLIPDLHFESNVRNLTVSPLKEGGGYIFCHKPGRFILTVNSPNHMSKDIHIDGKSSKYAFKISAKSSTGKIFFRTNPDNALVGFGLSGQSPQLTAKPIEMNTGEYHATISKNGYYPVDTTIIVPSGGNTETVDIILKPKFAKIHLDITTADGTEFKMYPNIEIDKARINMAELFDHTNTRTFDDAGNLEYFKLYQGGYIPVPPGAYNIRISAPNYKTIARIMQTTEGATSPLIERLEPISGYLTIIDKGNALDAKVMLNDTEIGAVPMFRKKVIVGNHIVRFEKNGFITPQKEYKISITEGKEEELPVSMKRFVEYRFLSEPSGAEILVDYNRTGFTPADVSLEEGAHNVIIRKAGYFDHNQLFTIGKTSDNTLIDTIRFALEQTFPILIKSEEPDLNIVIKRGKTIISSGITPETLQLPLGKYKLELFENKSKRYSGSFTHEKESDVVNAPVFSKGTFTTLVADLFTAPPKAKTKTEDGESLNYYDLMYSFQFGRFNLFPGLSTSILRASMFNVSKDFKKEIITTPPSSEIENINEDTYPNNLFSLSCLFLNGEFRVGGYPTKYFGVCALGSYVWYPPLTILDKSVQFSHISGQETFIGIEITSRISYFNANIKLGQEIYNGKYNYLLKNDKETQFFSNPFSINNFVVTVGVTLGQKKSKSNNMLKLW